MTVSEDALQVPCDRCGAAAGERCENVANVADVHIVRIERWRARRKRADGVRPEPSRAERPPAEAAAVREIIDGIRRQHGW